MEDKTVATISPEIENTDNFYCRYARQHEPQPAYVYLNCDTGKITADYSGEIGNACSPGVWHRRVLRWQIDPAANGRAVATRIEENLALFQSVLGGYTCKLDNQCNYVGHFTDAAAEAKIELGSQFETWETSEVDQGLVDAMVEGLI